MPSHHHGKDYVPIINELKRQGWRVDRRASGHYVAFPADPRIEQVTFGASPDRRAIKNTIAQLRKSGFVWPSEPH